MQVATYATRNFATLGQLELLPPFTGASIQSLSHFSFLPSSTGQVSDSIHRVTTWQSPVFLINSRYPLVCAAFPWMGKHPFSRSYGVILPSSFNMVLSSALVYSTRSPVSVWGTVSSPGGSPSQFEVFSWKFQPSLTMTTVATDY